MKSLKLMVLFGTILLGNCALSYGFIVHDPLNLAQNTQSALAAVQSSLELIDQSKRQIEQLKNSVQNLKHLSEKDWISINAYIRSMYYQVRDSQQLARNMSDLSAMFKKTYPDYEAKEDYSSQFHQWSDTVFKTFESSLLTLDTQTKAIHSEQSLLDELNRLSQSTEGRLQALEVANVIAIEQVAQLQKFRELMMAQSQLQLAYLSHVHQEKRVQHVKIEELIRRTSEAVRPNVMRKGFGVDSIPVIAPRPLR